MNLELSLDQLIRWLNTPLFSVGETDVNAMRIVGLVLILILSWWAARMIERTMVRLSSGRKTGMSDSALYALGRIMRYVIWIIGSVIGLSFIGFDLGSLAIMGGALGVGIGFGLQNIFSNLISGIIILLEKTLKVGDFVDLESGVMGRVAEINMRYTRIITNDAVDVLVPNSEFINGRVVNWTFGDSLRRIRVPFGVAYGTDKDMVRDVVLEAARSIEDTVEDATHQTEVWLVSFGESSLDFELLVWVGESGVRAPGRMLAKYLWAVETALSGAQIEIPFPQRDLHVRSGRLEVAMPEPADQGRPA
ncbi:mechanosensitive ion channel family protein [Nitrogeniibacter aestuarii]|uniref:mechanosensitive ion channel family protein n=1 Tax=Nitrogeniibacter aestuarii TaxID=2815343 RepID=UPI001D0FB1EB|nr:mechanosensitive ion channel domain-containing protein [Nitrogeniibacter aestuarii]